MAIGLDDTTKGGRSRRHSPGGAALLRRHIARPQRFHDADQIASEIVTHLVWPCRSECRGPSSSSAPRFRTAFPTTSSAPSPKREDPQVRVRFGPKAR